MKDINDDFIKINTDDIDVREIMQIIKKRAEQRKIAEPSYNYSTISLNTHSDQNNKIDTNYIHEVLHEINKSYLINLEEPIVNKRKILGKPIVFFRRVYRKLTRWYYISLFSQQNAYNSRATELLNEIVKCMDTMKINLNEMDDTIKANLNEMDTMKINLNENDMQIKDITDRLFRNEESNRNLLSLTEMFSEKMKLLEEKDVFIKDIFNPLDRRVYSQSGEDCILAHILGVLKISYTNITYLDLGANRPKEMSNTYYFYKLGAKGVLVEANPKLISDLQFYRHNDIILNNCVDLESNKYVNFYIMNGEGLSSPDLKTIEEMMSVNKELQILETCSVKTISINDILDKYFAEAPTIMSIDIEGKDLEVLKSINFEKYRPLTVVCEMVSYGLNLSYTSKNNQIVDFMKTKGYQEYAFTGVNSIFIDTHSSKLNFK